MKHNYKRILFLVLLITAITTGCKDALIEYDRVNFNSSNFPTTLNKATYYSIAFVSIATMRDFGGWNSFFDLIETCTDELLIPTRGGDWGDGGMWYNLHMHIWTADLPTLSNGWNWGFGGIGKCNNILKTLNDAPDFDGKVALIAEVRAMRALYYYYMMDAFGNVPIYLKTDLSDGLPATSPRADVFKFIESELLAIQPELPAKVDASTYGLPTLGFDQALLAKLYLNAQVYTGTARWADCITQCNALANSGKYGFSEVISSFSPRIPTPLAAKTLNKFMSIFAPDNGPQIKESIFAMANDGQKGSGCIFTQPYMPKVGDKSFLELPYGGWSGGCALPSFFAKFNDPNDLRNSMWLNGPLYAPDGVTVVKNFDGSPYVIIPELKFGVANPSVPYDVGGTADGQRQGVRCMKYYPDGFHDKQDNDVQIFRYADIILMRGEALARQGNDPKLALPDVNAVRVKRNAAPFTNLTWDDLLDERGREFAYEGWRRNDLIRFGQWGNPWGLKVNKEAFRTIFPIPTNQLQLNTNLKQNPGY